MSKISNLRLTGASLLAILLTACSGTSRQETDYIPFKADEDGKWGMISSSGEVLFDKEFRNAPTVVTDERFFVQNQDGFWELYSAETNPKRIGEEMRFASSFSCGAAMVTPRNSPISIINKKGEVIATLKEFENKQVNYASPFKGRNAVVTCDTLKGVIDVKGKTILKPEYSDIELLSNGLMIAEEYAFTSTHCNYYDTIPQKGKQLLLDDHGKELFALDGTKYWSMVKEAVTDKYIAVKQRKLTMKTEKAGKETYTYPEITWTYSLLDNKGSVIIEPNDKINQILAIEGELMIYTNEDLLCGVRTVSGEDIIKPEYTGINFIGKDYIAVYKDGDESSDWMPTIKVLDKEGKPFTHITFSAVAGNSNLQQIKGENLIAKEDKSDWTILDKKGVKLQNLPTIFELLPYSFGDSVIMSDEVEFSSFIKGLEITPSTFKGYNFLMGPKAAILEQQKQWSGDFAQEKPTPASYSWTQDIFVYGDVDGHTYSGEVHFPQTLSKQTYKQEKVIDYTMGNYYWYHIENKPTGFVFNNITPSYFKVTFSHWNFYGKLRELYKELVAYCKKWGTVEDSNNGATLIKMENGRYALITLSPEEVELKWGKLSDSERWIGSYFGNAEKLEPSYTGNEYEVNLNNNCYSSGDIEEEGD